jgi:ATP-dependent RNA helicase DDX41
MSSSSSSHKRKAEGSPERSETKKRARTETKEAPGADADDDSYVPYVPLKMRRQQASVARRPCSHRGVFEPNHSPSLRSSRLFGLLAQEAERLNKAQVQSLKARKEEERKLVEEVEAAVENLPKKSLLEEHRALMKERGGNDVSEAEKKVDEEKYLLEHINLDRAPLAGAKENAKGVKYTEILDTGWRPPKHIRDMSNAEADKVCLSLVLVAARGSASHRCASVLVRSDSQEVAHYC